jgi:hypothetical protein
MKKSIQNALKLRQEEENGKQLDRIEKKLDALLKVAGVKKTPADDAGKGKKPPTEPEKAPAEPEKAPETPAAPVQADPAQENKE